MIQKEFYMMRSDSVNLYRSYSDGNKYLLQVETGAVYDEAVDVEDAVYTYQEIDREETQASDEKFELDESADEKRI